MAKIAVLFAGGGTGGHIYPLIAVRRKLPENTDVRYFGSPGSFKGDLKENNIRVVHIASSKLRRYASGKNILDIFKFFWGFIQALWHVFWFMPNVVFSKGGPGALPVLLACRFYRIPIIIHETDSVPGRTNILSSKMARIVDLGFEGAKEYFPKKAQKKAVFQVVGNPVREEIIAPHSPKDARSLFGFSEEMPVLLFIGGSQGATALNDFILTNIEEFLDKFQIIHQVGVKNFEEYKKTYTLLSHNFSDVVKKRYRFYPFLGANMSDALDAADLVVSRAGGSIFEIAAKGRPAILVPLSAQVVGEHQIKNAYAYADTGAAVVIEEENLLRSVFLNRVQSILREPSIIEKMRTAAKNFSRPQAAEMIAKDIMSLV